MYLDKDFCDVVFVLDKEEIKAHKCILVARCEQFRALFKSSDKHKKKIVNYIDFNLKFK